MSFSAISPSLQNVATVAAPVVVMPGVLLVSVAISYKFHRFWRWLRVCVKWSNPDNFVQLAAGAGVNLLFGDRVPLRVAALMVWVPSRVVECIDNYNKLEKAYIKWIEAVRGDYPCKVKVRWVKTTQNRLLTPSWDLYWKEKGAIARIRTKRVAVCTVKLVKRIVLLSISCVDVADALSLKSSVCDRAVNEFFVDGVGAIDRIARQKEEVQRKLEENKPLANKLLKWLGTSYSADRLIDCISTAMDGVGLVDKGIKTVTEFADGMLVDLGKHAIFGVFSLLGIPEKFPTKLFPGEWERKYFYCESDERFVPEKWLYLPPLEDEAKNELKKRKTLKNRVFASLRNKRVKLIKSMNKSINVINK